MYVVKAARVMDPRGREDDAEGSWVCARRSGRERYWRGRRIVFAAPARFRHSCAGRNPSHLTALRARKHGSARMTQRGHGSVRSRAGHRGLMDPRSPIRSRPSIDKDDRQSPPSLPGSVIPAQAGIHPISPPCAQENMDPRGREDDSEGSWVCAFASRTPRG